MRMKPISFQLDLLNPGHENCRHRDYQLSCNNYEVLLERARGHCEICGLPGMLNQCRKLFIDHDAGRGHWAVRGLLCWVCNSAMFNPNVTDQVAVKRFLAKPFYLDVLAAYESPVTLAEPPAGSTVRDARGRLWKRSKDRWRTDDAYGRHHHGGGRDWHYLHYQYGPHILGQHLRTPN